MSDNKSCATCWLYMPDPVEPSRGACAFSNGLFHVYGEKMVHVYSMVTVRDGGDCDCFAIDRDAADEVITRWE